MSWERLDSRRYCSYFAFPAKWLKLCNFHKNKNIFQQCVNFVADFSTFATLNLNIWLCVAICSIKQPPILSLSAAYFLYFACQFFAFCVADNNNSCAEFSAVRKFDNYSTAIGNQSISFEHMSKPQDIYSVPKHFSLCYSATGRLYFGFVAFTTNSQIMPSRDLLPFPFQYGKMSVLNLRGVRL